MSEKEKYDDAFRLRLKKSSTVKFKVKCASVGKTEPVMMRELIDAFNEDRIRITPNDAQKEIVKIYQGEK